MAHVVDNTYGRNRDLGQVTDPALLAYYAGIGYTIDGTVTGTTPGPPAQTVFGLVVPYGATDGEVVTVAGGGFITAPPTGGTGGGSVTKAAVIATGLAALDIAADPTLPENATPLTSSGNLTIGKITPIDTTARAVVGTLPAGTTDGQKAGVRFKTGSNAASVTGTISGATNTIVMIPGELLVFRWDAGTTSWWSQAGNKPLTALDARFAPAGNYVPQTTTVNGHALTGNVTVTAADVGAQPAGGWYNVKDYGALGDGTTNDNAAIQAAIAAAYAAGGGTVYFPPGVYLLSSAPTSGTSGGGTYSGQLLIPARDGTTGPIAIRLLGASPPSLAFATDTTFTMPVESGGVILKSTATSGNVLDVIPAASGFGDLTGLFSNLMVYVENIGVRCPDNPQVGGLNLSKAACAILSKVQVGVNNSPNSITQPTGTVAGIQMPGNNNSANVVCRDTEVYGFPVGLIHAECTTLDNFQAYRNLVGIKAVNGYHASTYNSVITSDNVVHLQPASQSGTPKPTIVGSFDTQVNPSTGNWYITKATIDDLAGQLQGSLACVEVASGAGVSPSIMVRGANNLGLRNAAFDGPSSQRPTATSDSFTRSNTAWVLGTAESGQSWIPISGNAAWGISSNKAYTVSGTNDCAAVLKPHVQSSYTVTANVTTSATAARANAGLCVRLSGNTFFAAVLQNDGGGNRVRLYKQLAGTLSVGADGVFTVAANTTYALKVTVTSTTIVVNINGTDYITYTLTGGEQTSYNSNAYAGLWCYRSGGNEDGGSRWDDFLVV